MVYAGERSRHTRRWISIAAAGIGLLVAAPGAGASSRTWTGANPECTGFALTGDYQPANQTAPLVGSTRLTFTCSGITGERARDGLDVSLTTGSYFWSGSVQGPNEGTPADCLTTKPVHKVDCGFDLSVTGGKPNGTYVVSWTATDASEQAVSSCGIEADVWISLRGPNQEGVATDTDVGHAKGVAAGCHTPGKAQTATKKHIPSWTKKALADKKTLLAALPAVVKAESDVENFDWAKAAKLIAPLEGDLKKVDEGLGTLKDVPLPGTAAAKQLDVAGQDVGAAREYIYIAKRSIASGTDETGDSEAYYRQEAREFLSKGEARINSALAALNRSIDSVGG